MIGISRARFRLWVSAVAVASLSLGGACSSKTDSSGDSADRPVPRTLAATGAWARPTPQASTRGVIYLQVTTDRSDAVVGASVPATIAASASLHETMTNGGEHEKHGGPGATMTMEPVDRLPVAPGSPLVFEPGANHVMLEGLVAPLVRRGSFPLTLELESGRRLTTTVRVSDSAPEP